MGKANSANAAAPAVVMVVDFYPPEPGNRARRMSEIAEVLTTAGYSVTVVAPSRDGKRKENVQNGVRVVRLPPFFPALCPSMQYQAGLTSWFARVWRPFLGYVRWVVPAILMLRREHRSATLYTPNNPILLHGIGLLSKSAFSQWIAEMRDPITNYEAHRFSAWRFFPPLLESLVVRKADAVLLRCGLQISARELRERYPRYADKIHELPDYGLSRDDRGFLSGIRRGSPSPSQSLRGMYAGHFYAQRSPREIVEAIRHVNKNGRRVHVDFFGGWDSKVPDRGDGWAYHGVKPFENIRKKYREVDFTIIIGATEKGTEHQFLPSKLVELIVAGKPILVLGDPKSLVAAEVKGHGFGIVTQFSSAEIRQGLLEISEMVKSSKYNESARQEFVRRLDNNDYHARLVTVFHNVRNRADMISRNHR